MRASRRLLSDSNCSMFTTIWPMRLSWSAASFNATSPAMPLVEPLAVPVVWPPSFSSTS